MLALFRPKTNVGNVFVITQLVISQLIADKLDKLVLLIDKLIYKLRATKLIYQIENI